MKRRDLLAGGASLALAGAAPLAAEASAGPDPLIALWAELQAAYDAVTVANERTRAAEAVLIEEMGGPPPFFAGTMGGLERTFPGKLYDKARPKIAAALTKIRDEWNRRSAEMGISALDGEENRLGWAQEAAVRRIMETPATTREGLAVKLETALLFSAYDPNSRNGEDYPWCIILAVIDELRGMS